MPIPTESVLAVSDAERLERFEEAWAQGELLAPNSKFVDLGVTEAANDLWCEFVRNKIRAVVDDPATAEALCPTTYPFGTKRPCLDTNYFQTFNLPHVRLVDLRSQPIEAITEHGIDIPGEHLEFDAIVYATGFDAMTGALVGVDIQGRDGITLKQKWEHGPLTYLGLTSVGFPNLFMVTGPGSPSVLSNMVISIEQHVDWIVDTLDAMRTDGFTTIEPTPTAEAGWGQHVNDCADITLFRESELVVHGCERAGQAAGVPAVRRWGRHLPSHLRLGRRAGLPRVPAGRARRRAVQRRDRQRAATRRDVPARGDGRDGAPADRVDEPTGRPRVHGRVRETAPAGPRRRRDRGRHVAGSRRRPRLSAVPAGHGRPAPGRRLLPRRRLGARQSRLRRPVLSRSL